MQSPAHEFGGVDGSDELGHTMPLAQIIISQRLASHGLTSHVSSPELSSSCETHNRGETASPDFQEINIKRSRYFRNASGSGIAESLTALGWKELEGGVLFSSDAARDPPAQIGLMGHSQTEHRLPNSVCFEQQVVQSDGPGEETIVSDSSRAVEEPHEQEQSVPLMTLYSTEEVATARSSLSRARTRRNNSTRSSNDALSPEETSLQHLFAELSEQDHRPGILDRRRTSVPVLSRFTEDFDEPSPTIKPRASFFSSWHFPRLSRAPNGSYDGSGSVDLTTSSFVIKPAPTQKPKLSMKIELPKLELPPSPAQLAHNESPLDIWAPTPWQELGMDKTGAL
jgi:hypothetical protein